VLDASVHVDRHNDEMRLKEKDKGPGMLQIGTLDPTDPTSSARDMGVASVSPDKNRRAAYIRSHSHTLGRPLFNYKSVHILLLFIPVVLYSGLGVTAFCSEAYFHHSIISDASEDKFAYPSHNLTCTVKMYYHV
jgi:hypothetical protein